MPITIYDLRIWCYWISVLRLPKNRTVEIVFCCQSAGTGQRLQRRPCACSREEECQGRGRIRRRRGRSWRGGAPPLPPSGTAWAGGPPFLRRPRNYRGAPRRGKKESAPGALSGREREGGLALK